MLRPKDGHIGRSAQVKGPVVEARVCVDRHDRLALFLQCLDLGIAAGGIHHVEWERQGTTDDLDAGHGKLHL